MYSPALGTLIKVFIQDSFASFSSPRGAIQFNNIMLSISAHFIPCKVVLYGSYLNLWRWYANWFSLCLEVVLQLLCISFLPQGGPKIFMSKGGLMTLADSWLWYSLEAVFYLLYSTRWTSTFSCSTGRSFLCFTRQIHAQFVQSLFSRCRPSK